MVDWGDPKTFWLNAIHAFLGLATLIVIVVVAGAIALEFLRGPRTRRTAEPDPAAPRGDLPEVGPSLADGGEPLRGLGKPGDPGPMTRPKDPRPL